MTELKTILARNADRLDTVEAAMKHQFDTGGRRFDASMRTMHQGFRTLNLRLDQQDAVLDRLSDRPDDPPALVAV
jgi:hypothetical protein